MLNPCTADNNSKLLPGSDIESKVWAEQSEQGKLTVVTETLETVTEPIASVNSEKISEMEPETETEKTLPKDIIDVDLLGYSP